MLWNGINGNVPTNPFLKKKYMGKAPTKKITATRMIIFKLGSSTAFNIEAKKMKTKASAKIADARRYRRVSIAGVSDV